MKAQTDTLLSYLSEVPDKLVLSNPRKKSEIYRKIVIRKLDKGYLAEQYTEKQVFHENFAFCELQRFMENIPFLAYKQLDMWDASVEHHVLIGKGGELHWTKKQLQGNVKMQAKTANREKKYLIPEGTVVAPLVDLGIFTAEGKIVRTMYDKYRQINRFLELLDDEAGKLAGYYSKGRDSDKIEIDYLQKKNVKKPNGSAPGFVVYYTNYSLTIHPDISGIKLADE